MSDPARLVAGGAPGVTDFERDLLRSWETRQPSSAARSRALALAGAATVGAAVGLTSSAGAAAAGLGAAGGSVAPKAALASGVLVKWLAIGAVGVAVTAGAASYAVRSASSTSAPTAAVSPASPRSLGAPSNAAPAATSIALPPSNPGALPGTMTVPEPATPAPHAHSPSPRARSGLDQSTLEEEVASIDRARRAVSAGEPAAAIAMVDAYDAKFPAGSLAQESMVIRIDALLRQGDRGAAERLGSRFIAAHPSSPYVRRIRALLAGAPAR
jgi:hypothetical protein